MYIFPSALKVKHLFFQQILKIKGNVIEPSIENVVDKDFLIIC